MDAASSCRLLDWDTAFFGRRIASAGEHARGREEMERALEWCRARSIDCLYLLVSAADDATLRLAREHAFDMVDIRVTCDMQLGRADAAAGRAREIRLARESDIPDLRLIAALSHTDSRFYADGRFARERCDELYATWIEKSCRGWADAVFVAEHEGTPAGYLSCHERESGRGEIGLVGIAARAQGRGLGRKLLGSALHWFAQRGLERASVVTQGRNVAAQRLYQSAGFRTAAVQLWHHRWFTGEAPSRP
jgi:dTDP-4-amino-4,6-dideoxy-D-galactose acyltransferase